MFYLDPNYNFHWLESAPLGNVHLLQKYLAKFNEVQSDNRFTKQQKAVAIASLLHKIAELARVDEELLLFDIEGVINAIATVNFSVKKAVTEAEATNNKIDSEQEEEVVSLQDYHYQLITSLINTELAVDLESALKIAEHTPYKHLEGYVAARIKFLNRDKIEAKEKEIETKKLENFVDSQIQNGTFYTDMLDPATAGKVPIDLSALR